MSDSVVQSVKNELRSGYNMVDPVKESLPCSNLIQSPEKASSHISSLAEFNS